jgi:hypothetical protein
VISGDLNLVIKKMISKIREECGICARDVGSDGIGGLCNYCQKFHLRDQYGPDPLAECDVWFKTVSLFSCYFMNNVTRREPCYKRDVDRSLRRKQNKS